MQNSCVGLGSKSNNTIVNEAFKTDMPVLLPTAIGSLPHADTKSALDLVFDTFPSCPMWPQLVGVDRREDMTRQYVQGLPGLDYDEKKGTYFFNTVTDRYFEELEEFFLDYEAIITEKNYENLDKYAITEPYSSAVSEFFSRISKMSEKPAFAKGHIIGPLTWGTSICDETGRCAFYDDVLREVLVKGLTLKALWQIRELKKVSPETKMIMFMDEPAMSQYGTSALITIEKSDIICAIKEISEVIKGEGALSGVHCCGKTDWSIITDTNVSILNFDAFFFAKSLALYAKSIEKFLKRGSMIAWGLIPTLDTSELEKTDEQDLLNRFEDAVLLLVKKGLSKDFVLSHSLITPSCGAGGLNIEQAQKAMRLTASLAKNLKNLYCGKILETE